MAKDIRILTSFLTNKKRKRLRMKMGGSPLGNNNPESALLDIWLTLGSQDSEDGFIGCQEDLEIMANWTGEPGKLYDFLSDFIDEVEGVYFAHDWADNQPWVSQAKSRSKKASKAAGIRWGNNPQCGEDANRNAPFLSLPSPSLPNPSLPGQADQEEIVKAICEIAELDPGIYKNATNAFDISNSLISAGYTLEDLKGFREYWDKEDWRGQKGQAPALSQVVTEIKKAKEWKSKGKPKRGNPNQSQAEALAAKLKGE